MPNAVRLGGADRYATSVVASQSTFPNGADAVLIASGTASVDGVIASGIAASLDAPLLYVQSGSIPSSVVAELQRLTPQRIIVVGGEAVVSASAYTALRGYAPDVSRLAGADSFGTSRAALTSLGRQFATVYIAGGASMVDSPVAFSTAAALGFGSLLVNGLAAAPDQATIDALRSVGATRIVIVGGTTTVGAAYQTALSAAGFAVERRNGADRYATAVLLTGDRTTPGQRAIVANSNAPSDVAVAAALAGATLQPLLYVIDLCAPDSVASYLSSAGLPVTGVGGPNAVGPDALAGRSCTDVRASLQTSLQSAISATMAQYAGSFTVTVRQIGGLGEAVALGGATRREPASMMKIFAAWAALTRVQQGRATLTTVLPSGVALATCIHIMIHVSDNFCHSDIVHWIGLSEVNRMIAAAGFADTSYGYVAPGTSVLYAGNRTTTDDLALMMQRLANGTVLAKVYADRIITEMRGQIWRSRIASGIPPGVPQASKPGSLWIDTGLTQGDTAIVNGPRYSYILSIIGLDNPPQEALRAISRTVYTHFNGAFGAAATYPVQQMITQSPSILRSSPAGPAVGTLAAGIPVQVLDAQRVWYEIQYGGRTLWVYYSGLRNR